MTTASMATETVTVLLQVQLSADTVRYLEVLTHSHALGARATVTEVLQHLAHSAADGCRRPGSWERTWVEQAFGPDFADRLVQDPECEWREVPES